VCIKLSFSKDLLVITNGSNTYAAEFELGSWPSEAGWLATAPWVADIYVAYTYNPNYNVFSFSCLLTSNMNNKRCSGWRCWWVAMVTNTLVLDWVASVGLRLLTPQWYP